MAVLAMMTQVLVGFEVEVGVKCYGVVMLG
jgi:hypothetical protein